MDNWTFGSQSRALMVANAEGWLDAIPAMADKAAEALHPVGHKALLNRLTMLGMSMAHGKSPEEQTAWLHETARLLVDLPQGVLFDAIDECVKEPGRVFAPSVGEIRGKAADPLKMMERQAARLRALALLMADPSLEIPEWEEPQWPLVRADEEPKEICTPEEARAILTEFGIGSGYSEKLAGILKPEPELTRADYIAAGREPPPLKPRDESDRITV